MQNENKPVRPPSKATPALNGNKAPSRTVHPQVNKPAINTCNRVTFVDEIYSLKENAVYKGSIDNCFIVAKEDKTLLITKIKLRGTDTFFVTTVSLPLNKQAPICTLFTTLKTDNPDDLIGLEVEFTTKINSTKKGDFCNVDSIKLRMKPSIPAEKAEPSGRYKGKKREEYTNEDFEDSTDEGDEEDEDNDSDDDSDDEDEDNDSDDDDLDAFFAEE